MLEREREREREREKEKEKRDYQTLITTPNVTQNIKVTYNTITNIKTFGTLKVLLLKDR